MKTKTEDRSGHRVALTTAVLCALTVSALAVGPVEAQRPPANRTYFAILLSSEATPDGENPFAWSAECLTFTATEVCTIKGDCGAWYPTETAGGELAFALDMSYETHGTEALIDGHVRVDTRGSRHSLGGVARRRHAGTTANFGFVARPVDPRRCPVVLEQWIHKSQANPACLEEAIFGDPADSAYVLPYPPGVSSLVDATYCNGANHAMSFSYDFRLPIGSELVAVRAGVVLEVRDDLPDNAQMRDPATDSQGNYIRIEHDDGTLSSYSHLCQGSIVVQPGEAVVAGQLIGLSGYSGNAHAPHLHFTVFSPLRPGGFRESLPVNFRNSAGRLDPWGGLMKGVVYEALP